MDFSRSHNQKLKLKSFKKKSLFSSDFHEIVDLIEVIISEIDKFVITEHILIIFLWKIVDLKKSFWGL